MVKSSAPQVVRSAAGWIRALVASLSVSMALWGQLPGWQIVASDRIFEVEDGKAVSVYSEELQPRKAGGVLWGWNEWSNNNLRPLQLRYDVSRMPEEFRDECLAAIQAWGTPRSRVKIHTEPGQDGQERTLVFELVELRDGLLGEAEFPWMNGPSAHVRLNSRYYPSGKYSMLRTLIHEVGHAIGLTHVDEPDSVMYPVHNWVETVTLADQMRAAQLYRTRPVPSSPHN